MPESSLALDIKNLKKTYAKKKGEEKIALHGIDLQVEKGAFFGLLGPNGAGKSTLINILAGLVVKSSGTVAICGHDLDKNTRNARKSLGIVPQELVLDPFFPAREALEFTAGYYGIPKKDRRSDEILEAVGLSDKAKSPARSLSGGMRRRLLVAKALVHLPDVLILDEPTAGVDVELRTQLWEYVVKLNKQGTTILLTTHYLEEAEELCDDIAVINHGKIIARDKKSKIMKTIDQKRLIITPREKLEQLPDSMKKFNGKVTSDGNVEINYQSTKTEIDEILNAFCESKYSIKDLSTKEPDLEEVFRYLTKN